MLSRPQDSSTVSSLIGRLVGGFKHFFMFHHILGIFGNNPSHWLSYFSEGLKPPTRRRNQCWSYRSKTQAKSVPISSFFVLMVANSWKWPTTSTDVSSLKSPFFLCQNISKTIKHHALEPSSTPLFCMLHRNTLPWNQWNQRHFSARIPRGL